jgi:hypothetical protein
VQIRSRQRPRDAARLPVACGLKEGSLDLLTRSRIRCGSDRRRLARVALRGAANAAAGDFDE